MTFVVRAVCWSTPLSKHCAFQFGLELVFQECATEHVKRSHLYNTVAIRLCHLFSTLMCSDASGFE